MSSDILIAFWLTIGIIAVGLFVYWLSINDCW